MSLFVYYVLGLVTFFGFFLSKNFKLVL